MDRLYRLVGCIMFCCVSMLLVSEARAQCNQRYAWATWDKFTGNKATGAITVNSKVVGVNMSANYTFGSTASIFSFSVFNKFKGYNDIPNSTVPRTTWAAGAGGQTTMCFSEPVTNPVLLIASLGTGLRFSEEYIVLHDVFGMKYIDSHSLSAKEGNAIVLFPGIFTCLTIYSETPEYYTNITWGMQVPLSPVTIAEKSVDCGGVTLTASGGQSYKWNGGQQPTSATNTVTTSGIYSVTATDQNGCITIALKDVPAIPKPALTQTVSKTICQGETYAGYGASGVYVDQITTRYGCDSTRTLLLTVDAPPIIDLKSNYEVCQGQSVVLKPTVTTSQPVQYSWSTGETSTNLSTTQAGTYSVRVTNGICAAVGISRVTVHPLPDLLPDETRACTDAVLSAGSLDNNLSYVWQPTGETTPTIMAPQPGTYRVIATTPQSCSASRTIFITGSCNAVVFGPTSFTPNGDLVNDRFSLMLKNGTPISLMVYNRWGGVLYSEESTNPSWDGTHQGNECSSGTYLYRFTYSTGSSNRAVLTHEGTVILLR